MAKISSGIVGTTQGKKEQLRFNKRQEKYVERRRTASQFDRIESGQETYVRRRSELFNPLPLAEANTHLRRAMLRLATLVSWQVETQWG